MAACWDQWSAYLTTTLGTEGLGDAVFIRHRLMRDAESLRPCQSVWPIWFVRVPEIAKDKPNMVGLPFLSF